MGRPPLPVGAHGKIHVTDLTVYDVDGKPVGPKRFEARCRYRDKDGTFRQLRRTGKSAAAAENAVKKRVAELANEIRGGELGPTSRFRAVAEAWLDELSREADLGTFSHDSVRLYRGALDNHILPRVGELRFGTELTGTALDKLVKNRHDKVGYATARTVRAVLRGVCTYAVRHHVRDINLAASIGRLVQAEAKEIRALTPAERKKLIAGLEGVAAAHATDAKGRSLGARAKVWADLPDLVRAMLCTGVRLGELLALVGPNFGRNAEGLPVLHVEAHLVREHGKLVRKPYRKGSKNRLILRVPEWSVPMWQRRKLAAGFGPMFGGTSGQWVHPDNMGHRIREAFDQAGFAWVKSHNFRKTVASVLDEADLPTRAIADQLGHTNEATAKRFYIAPRAGNESAVQALEGMMEGE